MSQKNKKLRTVTKVALLNAANANYRQAVMATRALVAVLAQVGGPVVVTKGTLEQIPEGANFAVSESRIDEGGWNVELKLPVTETPEPETGEQNVIIAE
jgi:hypothetical protein